MGFFWETVTRRGTPRNAACQNRRGAPILTYKKRSTPRLTINDDQTPRYFLTSSITPRTRDESKPYIRVMIEANKCNEESRSIHE
jgi:hypothetical protein